MRESKTLLQDPDHADAYLCPGCIQPVDPAADFCPNCGTPLSSIATIDPIMQLRTYRHFFTKVSGRSFAAKLVCILFLAMIFIPLVYSIVKFVL